MRKSKKHFLTGMAVCLTLSMLTACGKPADSGKSRTSDSTAASSAEKSTETETKTQQDTKKESQPEATQPEPKLDPATITFYNLGDASDGSARVLEEINKKLQAELNTTLKINYLSWADWTTQYPLLFASGEDFDMIYTSNWAFYAQQARKGAFMELSDEMLKTYAPRNYAKLDAGQWDQTRIDGSIYMVPNTGRLYTKLVYLVRGDLREKYGIPEIEDKDGLIAYWDAVAKNESGNGILPYAMGGAIGSECTYNLKNFSTYPQEWYNDHTFITYNDTIPFGVVDSSDPANVKFADTTDYDIENYKLIKSFRENGYWSQNALSQTDEATSLWTKGKTATVCHAPISINNFYVDTMTNHPEWKPEMVDILPDVPTGVNPIINNGTAINAGSKNPERALMVLDLLSQDRDYFDLSVYGIRGTDWNAEGDGDISMIAGVPDPFGGFGMGWNLNLPRISKDSAPNYLSMLDGFEKKNFTSELSLMSFDDTKVKNEIAAVSAVRSKYGPILEFGFADDVEATYQEYRSELKKAGLDAIQEEFKRQAEEFLKK